MDGSNPCPTLHETVSLASSVVQVKLILKEQLDRESQVQHRMTLIAADGGPQPKTGSTLIVVNVIDSNDNKPTFVGGPTFEVSVVENTPPGTVIIRLEASDADEGPNGQVRYSFAPSTLNSASAQVFSIRNDTGEILVKVCIHVYMRTCKGQGVLTPRDVLKADCLDIHLTIFDDIYLLHWLPVEQRIYKLTVLAFKTQKMSSPQYLNQHISLRTSARNTRSSSVPLLCVPFLRTSFSRRSFSTAAPLTWNSRPPATLNCDSLSTFKSRLKTHLFSTAFC